jgi:hypothetical protein
LFVLLLAHDSYISTIDGWKSSLGNAIGGAIFIGLFEGLVLLAGGSSVHASDYGNGAQQQQQGSMNTN